MIRFFLVFCFLFSHSFADDISDRTARIQFFQTEKVNHLRLVPLEVYLGGDDLFFAYQPANIAIQWQDGGDSRVSINPLFAGAAYLLMQASSNDAPVWLEVIGGSSLVPFLLTNVFGEIELFNGPFFIGLGHSVDCFWLSPDDAEHYKLSQKTQWDLQASLIARFDNFQIGVQGVRRLWKAYDQSASDYALQFSIGYKYKD